MGITTVVSLLLLYLIQWTTAQPGPASPRGREVLDTVLTVSIDGCFHALNRTTGKKLWSTSSLQLGHRPEDITSLPPLVYTVYANEDPIEHSEPYIVEPQSGDIYLVNSTDGSIQRFPWSVPEIVAKSPFTPPGDERRVFTGRKKTRILLLDVETGAIKHKDDFSYEDRCSHRHELKWLSLKRSSSTEVLIHRTDYHVSIHDNTQGSNGNGRRITQNLSLSVYAARDKDTVPQAAYQVTADNHYIQGITNGEVYSFKKMSNGGKVDVQPLWTQHLHVPTVAIFDVLIGPSPLPHVLLQPRLQVEDLMPNIDPKTLPRKDSAYFGRINKTQSLYVLTAKYYPLAVLSATKKNDEQHR